VGSLQHTVVIVLPTPCDVAPHRIAPFPGSMAANSSYPYYFTPPLVDHLHERSHQHQTLFQSIFHQSPHPKENPNFPDVDVSEYPAAYCVEIEVPGVQKAEDVRVHLYGNHSMVISGEVVRHIPSGLRITDQTEDGSEHDHKSDQNSGDGNKVSSSKAKPATGPLMLVGERRLGYFRRMFYFPHPVDHHKGVKANLQAGVLTLIVQKKYGKDFESQKVDVDLVWE
jgi:HSP20 family molecular chaperone IbpA